MFIERCPDSEVINIPFFTHSVSRHQPEVNLLSQQWAEFHSHYQSFHQWLRNMDTEMANLNPFVSNMATVQMQLVKLKVKCSIHTYTLSGRLICS